MKFFPKILTILFLLIFIFQLTCLLFLTLAPNASQAAELKFKPQVGLPVERQSGDTFDFSGKIENIFPKDGSTKPIAEYIRAIYKYAIGIVGILAAVVLMIGGVMWIVAGGNATTIGEAKAWIGASLTGLTLALLSYLILATVNPALVNLRTTAIKNVASIGCCVPNNNDNNLKCTTSEINDIGEGLCLNSKDKYNPKPCYTIPQCEQYIINCDGSNNGQWCGDKKTQVCFEGECQECSSQRNADCGIGTGVIDPFGSLIQKPTYCCPGLRCNNPILGKCVDQFL